MSAYSATPLGVVLAGIGLLTVSDLGQLIGLLIVLVTFFAVGRTRAKDATIRTWRENAEAEVARAGRLATELKGAQERGDREHERRRECERQISHLEGEIKTLERYTAQEALTEVARSLAETRTAIVTAIQSSNELVMRNTAILAAIDSHLGNPSHERDDLPFGGHDRPPA